MTKAKLVPVEVENLKIGDDIKFKIKDHDYSYEGRIKDISDIHITIDEYFGILRYESHLKENIIKLLRYE